MVRSELLKGHLDLLVLSALEARPAHGYAVVERLAELSDGEFALPEPTVYAVLYRLERAGYLRSHSTTHRGRRRRVYSLTRAGTAGLEGRRREWEQFSLNMRRTLEATG